MRTSIPNPIGGGVIGAHRFNQLCETAEGATYRGKGHKTTRGVIPRISSRINSVSPFTGVAYVSGVRIEGLNTYPALPWVRVNVSANTAVEDAGPPSDPFPDNEEWYEKANTYGDIHVTRFG